MRPDATRRDHSEIHEAEVTDAPKIDDATIRLTSRDFGKSDDNRLRANNEIAGDNKANGLYRKK